ncbi:hypothetical protein BGX21_011027 [Mortierella sp. AD011]|nr:hypothetical protein BGX20_003463 [Mortierella sp. AD010]KAF9392361.1 hypothetical protein BGX21_011027 [Mortierella sp. AD011]
MYNEKMKVIKHMNMGLLEEKLGYQTVVFSRPEFYNLLLSHIPKSKIFFRKKVLSTSHPEEGGVAIHCSDNSTYYGDILVGADGTYSGVRQSMYRSLQEKSLLPFSDTQALDIGYLTLVGTTDPMDAGNYPELKDNFNHFHFVIGNGKPYTWYMFTVPKRKICWGVQCQLTENVAKDMLFRNTTWGSEGNEGMIKDVYNFPTPYGPLGLLIDATPRERISKVFLEEKLFETWHHDRIVLIGDAAHKMSPSHGLGAVNAVLDAIVLANNLYEIGNSASPKNIAEAFQNYKKERYPHVHEHFKASKILAKIMLGQKWSDKLLRKMVLRYLPDSIANKRTIKGSAYRPQCVFLPLAPKRGTCRVLPQKPSKRDGQLAQQ